MNRNARLSRDGSFRLLGFLIVLIIFCILSPTFARFYTDYLWFESLDLAQVFERRITASLALAGAAALISVAFLLLNWSLVAHWIVPTERLRRTIPLSASLRSPIRGRPPQRTQIDVSARPVRIAFAVGAVLIGVIVGVSLSGEWQTLLLALDAVPFNFTDPIFGQDISLYVFQLPWYRVLLGRGQILLALALGGVLARYALFGEIRARGVTAHLSLLGSAWLVLMGCQRLLSRLALLQTQEGAIFGAGYTDIHARLPLYTVEAILFFAAAAILVINLFARQWRLLIGIGLFWVGLTLIGPLYPAMVQQFSVEPNEFALERPYIEHNIRYTREAYQLGDIAEQNYAADGILNQSELAADADVLRNVRLWDYRPLLRTYSQLQEIRLYYSFHSVDVDRYQLGDQPTQVMLAVRELDVDELATQAQTWINRHLVFTHGYGLALSSVNDITLEGLPKLLVRDIPPISDDPILDIARPEIYFGERTREYALVQAVEEEFDYPQGDSNVYTRYQGSAGVRLGNALRRTLLATRFSSTQVLLSSALSNDSRVLFHRDIRDRAETIAPMLWYDDDPYPIIADGRIIWLLDAYTWTDQFPYSQPMTGLNYIRNSIKVTIDAYSGEIHFYIIDPQDPVAATYARIFPMLFEDGSQMPEVLRSHWRYPETLFLYQSELYATYHMRDPQVFYNREDLWDPPHELVETEQQVMEPYYVTMRLPGSDEPEFLLIRPYVPRQKQNMVAWLYARCDGDVYGELGIFKLAKDRLVFGPLQIEGRVDQNPVISQQLSLWDQRGSRVLRGNLLVLPIQDTFLYIEPLYLEAESGQLPELKRVLVAYADRIAMAPTLDEALLQIFAEGGAGSAASGISAPAENESLEELAGRAWQHYQAAQACLEAADWSCYGREQSLLESALKLMVHEQ
ncbi:MAG: UPF0182 family protein [Anaerolineae bacterium]|nr:UPF0182 family protein [Anaerolineae bacterium]